ncbi:MAG TPA: hypothetical protein VK976_15460 [Verrucomicrobiae bacterium]|jgi:hypothetical protein|nr:hypothetical protein [Verrucomicrobiae bacterium]
MMKRLCVTVVLAGLAAGSIGVLAAQDAAPAPAAQASTANPENQIKGAIPVRLVKPVDSKKLKEGDPIICETVAALHARSGLMIPSESKVIGHVTKSQARSKGDADSTLGIAFDKIEYAKGEDVPIKGILQAVGPSLGGSGPNVGPAEPGTLAGKGGSGTTAAPTSSMQIGGAKNGTPILVPTSQGVLGLKNLEMGSDGVLTSTGKEVKLDAGTQLLINVQIDLPSR